MKTLLTYKCLLIIGLLVNKQNLKKAQDSTLKECKIINFLVKHHQFVNTTNNWVAYKDFIHERVIYKKRNRNGLFKIFIFGENSSHGKSYIGLESPKTLSFLETKELDGDLKVILRFITASSQLMRTKSLTKLLNEITNCYINNKLDYSIYIDPPPITSQH